MNELIQALGQYTEALESRIAALEERISGYEEKVAALEEQLSLLKDKLEDLGKLDQLDNPEMPKTPEEPEPEPELEPELALEPEMPESPKETKKVDIRQMISLGDRFLFQRELFGQNGEKMQRALDEINQCATEQEALDYVEQHFDWDKKSPTYELFIHAIHRSHTGR